MSNRESEKTIDELVTAGALFASSLLDEVVPAETLDAAVETIRSAVERLLGGERPSTWVDTDESELLENLQGCAGLLDEATADKNEDSVGVLAYDFWRLSKRASLAP